MTLPTAHPLRPELRDLPMPVRLRACPVDARGYPVPFFVAVVDGVPDHRIADLAKLVRCVQENLCWLCGHRLGAYLAFVIGPMCAVNRISADAPMHRDCAEYAIHACPFLTRPHMVRREGGKPDDVVAPPGEMIARNPGVMLLWITRSWRPKRDPDSARGFLFDLSGPFVEVLAYAEGRPATPAEVQASLESGLPLLAGQIATTLEWADFRQAVREAGVVLGLTQVHLPPTPVSLTVPAGALL